jgi:hypothetical protein
MTGGWGIVLCADAMMHALGEDVRREREVAGSIM